jgi:hypothetical protein
MLNRLFATLAAAVLLIPNLALAQSLTQGAVSGTVTDSTNAVVANATVTITSMDKGFSSTAVTNEQGVFKFPLVAPGSYAIVVRITGFKQYETKAVVNLGQTTIVDTKLEVGSTGTTVDVTGATPSSKRRRPT